MHRVLVVSPHFPPVNMPDMHRVRMCVPHFGSFGWQPLILAVAPDRVEGVQDPLLAEMLPSDLEVERVPAIPARLSRLLGIGNLGLRSFGWLRSRGSHLIERRKVDLIYFSTTVFTVLRLGPIWKRRYGLPYVVDMQDPWVSDYPAGPERRGLKHRLARRLHRFLEPRTMREVDGLLAVSEGYIRQLRSRYSRLENVPAVTLPFGYAERDFKFLQAHPQPNDSFQPGKDGLIHGVYVGRGGQDMSPALESIFGALRTGLRESPELFQRVRLHFIGTDYAPPPRGRFTVAPVAERFGVGDRVQERPERIPYCEALQLLHDSDFLVVPGSDDPHYTASKIYPYVLARKPLLCVFHEKSSVVDFVRRMDCGQVVAFQDGSTLQERSARVLDEWRKTLDQLGTQPPTRWIELAAFSAPEMARRQCQLFDEVLAQTT